MDYINETNINNTLLYFVFGFGDGSIIQNFLNNSSSWVKFVVFEPDLTTFMQHYNEDEMAYMLSDGRLTLVIKEDESKDELTPILNTAIQPYNAKHIKSIILPEYSAKYADEYNKINNELVKIAKERISSSAGMKLHAEVPCKNELYALSTLSDNAGCKALFDGLEDKNIPIIIVAAGPSLDKNVFELKRAYNKALIISVSRAAILLNNKGIKADLIAQLDPQSYGFLDFDEKNENRILISSKGDIEVQKQYRGKCIYYDFSGDLTGNCPALEEIPVIEEHGGSVATYICSLFLESGFKNIILVGQDLAFSENNETHAGGDSRIQGSTEVVAEVPGINGNMVKTRHDWLAFINCFEAFIKKYSDATVIDATEGGALIHGSRVMTLSDAIDTYCTKEYPIYEILNNLKPIQTVAESNLLADDMFKIANSLSSIEDKIREFISIGQRLLNEKNSVSLSEKQRYDSLYYEVLQGKTGNILIYYCEDFMQNYINYAVSFEASQNQDAKIKLEIETFSKMLEKIPELRDYMLSIYG